MVEIEFKKIELKSVIFLLIIPAGAVSGHLQMYICGRDSMMFRLLWWKILWCL